MEKSPRYTSPAGVPAEMTQIKDPGIQSGIQGITVHKEHRHLPREQVRKWRVATSIVGPDGDYIRLPNGTPKVWKWDLTGTLREAVAERDRRKAEVLAGQLYNHDKPSQAKRKGREAGPMTVRKYAERYYFPWLEKNREDNTADSQMGRISNHILPHWGHLTLTEIQKPEVLDQIKAYLKDPTRHPRKPGLTKNSSRNQVLLTLGAMLTHASKPHTAPGGVPLCLRHEIPLLPKDLEQHSTLESDDGFRLGHLRYLRIPEEEVSKLEAQAQKNELPWDYAIVGLGLYCGLRIGEIAGLRWVNVDFERGLIKVCEQVQKANKRKGRPAKHKLYTKNREVGYVGVDGDFLQYLKNLKERGLNGEFVCGPITGGFRGPDDLTTRYSFLARKAWGRDCTNPHSLRHTYATRLADDGLSPTDIKEALRDSSIETAYGYIHPSEDLQDKIKATAQKLRAIPGGKSKEVAPSRGSKNSGSSEPEGASGSNALDVIQAAIRAGIQGEPLARLIEELKGSQAPALTLIADTK